MNKIVSLLDSLINLTKADKIFWKKDGNGDDSYRLLTPSFIISFCFDFIFQRNMYENI